MTLTPARRLVVLAVLVVVILACLLTSWGVVESRGTGDGLGDKISSLQDEEAPASAEVKDREQLLSLSREFATRFNTYDSSMLDDQGQLPDYRAVSELMTPKFADVFDKNVTLPEKTVAELDVASVGTVYAVGVESQDDDSAEVLVAGTVELSYPYSEDGNDGGQGGSGGDGGSSSGDSSDEPPRVSTGPQRFRYEVSLVKVDGTWLVDDVDDVDDGRPPFSQPAIPEQSPGATPSTTPSTDEPSADPTSDQTGEGGQ